MNMLKLRKICLLSAIAVLTLIYILQILYQGKSAVRDDILKHEAGTIEVRLPDGSAYTLQKEGEDWLIDSAAKADSYSAGEISGAVQKVRILGKVGTTADAERFGLDDAHAIRVTARKDGETLRTLLIGKAAPTAGQTYIAVGDSQTVLLVAGDLNDTFSKKASDLQAKEEEQTATEESDTENTGISEDKAVSE